MAISRNDIFEALKNYGAAITWGPGDGGRFVTVSRRLRDWTKVPGEEQPALFQVEPPEDIGGSPRGMPMRTYHASWIILQNSGIDPDAVPAAVNNDIVDAIDAAFWPVQPGDPGARDNRFTLGGLVHRCWIEGTIVKIAGDLDNQGMITVPISILVP